MRRRTPGGRILLFLATMAPGFSYSWKGLLLIAEVLTVLDLLRHPRDQLAVNRALIIPVSPSAFPFDHFIDLEACSHHQRSKYTAIQDVPCRTSEICTPL